ncbi:hypothetical protein NEOLEDRAFT_97575 [Neolentinus lepideus HHB14362 ss-1]|uniref:Uncharacterized protein n=1 Tax=Neolentinus lepideus HHB14362 ss-1 TaxID=1314782 RepID=A0A165U318_9AGAM|nr:hypothetical protein NEOLEDRAFT_97575 [Neolentinus lepideus HHB14362 ss-1]
MRSSSGHESGVRSCQSADAAGQDPLAETQTLTTAVLPLLISPNLEALLEHDNRARCSPIYTPGCVSPIDRGTSTVGLPPPRKRRSRSNTAGAAVAAPIVNSETRGCAHHFPCKTSSQPTTAKEHEPVVAAASLSDASPSYHNPFLNPTPSLQSLAFHSCATLCSGASPHTSDHSDGSHDKPRRIIPLSLSNFSFTNDVVLGGAPHRVSLFSNLERLSSYHSNHTKASSSGQLELSLSSKRDIKGNNQQSSPNQIANQGPSPVVSVKQVILLETSLSTRLESLLNEEMSSADSVDDDHTDAHFPQREDARPSAATSGNINPAASFHNASGACAPSRLKLNVSYPSESRYASASSAISISGTQYPSSMNTIESQRYRRPAKAHTTSPTQSGNRESFIDWSSPSSPVRRFVDGSDHSGETSPAMPTFVVHKSAMSSKSSLDSDISAPRRQPLSGRSPTSMSFPLSVSALTPRSQKPPIPTAPKPKFRRSASAQPAKAKRHDKASSSSDTLDVRSSEMPLPPTTNLLNSHERAELIRKTRKLTQVFGKPPEASAVYPDSPVLGLGPQLLPQARRGHHRGAVSMVTNAPIPRAMWPPPEGTQYLSPNGRRFSTPLSPDQLSFLSVDPGDRYAGRHSPISSQGELYIEIGSQEREPHSGYEDDNLCGEPPDSPTSFMDLSEEEVVDDMSSFLDADSPKSPRRRRPFSPSTPTLMETLSLDGQSEEEERRRKRERLAKLHRFLGSRVPVGLVLGVEDPLLSPLPPPALQTVHSGDEELQKAWVRRRRSSSAAAFPARWSDDVDRLKEDLDEREKAINVRRAQKMEKMFGATPPQALYHTRKPSTMVNTDLGRFGHSHSPPPTATAAGSPTSRNVNQSAYTKVRTKGKKKSNRPGTSESSQGLLQSENADYRPEDSSPVDRRLSIVYMHYRHSLESLNNILDRDDKESLAQLHQYLNGAELPLQTFNRDPQPSERKMSISSSMRSERRRSLPPRTSVLSLASEYNLGSPDADMTSFQLRRRKAAKLTNFFGVDYRDLISDVLESIEKGVEEDGGKGTLKPEEVQDLMKKLRSLRTKRNVIS